MDPARTPGLLFLQIFERENQTHDPPSKPFAYAKNVFSNWFLKQIKFYWFGLFRTNHYFCRLKNG